ncbi:DUF4861 family protein [Maribacter sp. 1_2014MBL_MicDiv]|uniref:DUF4861 family protein n=1 Tax=Maribacter sp. 1_2014MBL_MicDiv TaxID=1644130 RepID=UPI0008F4C9A7|nr:DUF4861 family protein [Maribacter sp. 1_2014MBL_MicDiv]APA66225.1 hypothetical protein YQ22_02050 [Maribacter sp. 1_2014MBL_MicDiv]
MKTKIMINQIHLKYCAVVVTLFLIGCTGEKPLEIEVVNHLNIDRSLETVEIDLALLQSDESLKLVTGKSYKVSEVGSGTELVSQLSDVDGDGAADVLLIQPEIAANSSKTFNISLKDAVAGSEDIPICYSRFVPERTDDYAWENDRVAFRTYGPVAQKMIEDSIPGGTLSSGMDAWLKRVDYPIINKWYKKELETEGTYHEDDGEGLDNFHVGTSRGVGGIAVKADTTYQFSRNFTDYKTIETGPLRTSFWITYAPWKAGDKTIAEKKFISLDRGSNLSKYRVEVNGSETISVGLTLHEKDGEIAAEVEQGWVSYWEPYFGSELGTGVVVPSNAMLGYDKYMTNAKDLSNLYAQVKVINGEAVYYTGFGWKKSKQFNSKEEWNAYLKEFAQKVNAPLEVKVK